MASPPKFPLAWGHRGASADYPENTLASFESAARAGADGIESDVHVTSDDYILMFHDPELGRTTIGGSGSINSQTYKGNIENLKTSKAPHQKIPTFAETIDWFNRKENQHLTLNIDVKANNDPVRLFTLMEEVLSKHENWETDIAPRLILGIWHPKFIPPALTILPYLKRCFIGVDITLASHPIFWNNMHAFSVAFQILTSSEGRKFMQRAKKEGKEIYTWTLNQQEQWATAAKWGVDVVMTDKPLEYMAARNAAIETKKPFEPRDPWFMWRSPWYWTIAQWVILALVRKRLNKLGGPIQSYLIASVPIPPAEVVPKPITVQ